MDDVYVIGVGITKFGACTNSSVKDLVAEAVVDALDDAQLGKSAIQTAFFSNAAQGALEGQHAIRGQIALRAMGFSGLPVTNVENACASGSTAFHLAQNSIRAGAADITLAVGAEKMVVGDRRALLSVFDGGWDVHEPERNLEYLATLAADPDAPKNEGKQSVFVEVLAALARRHMNTFGTTVEQIAAVASKNHAHSQFNEMAQFQKPFTVDEVLAARQVASPLTVPMCSPISDGAAAAILCSGRMLKKLGLSRSVLLRASILTGSIDRQAGEFEKQIGRLAALQAYEKSGVDPKEVSVAEVHDASAFGEIAQSENLGFFAYGEGAAAAERGETTIGGRIPINPSGGMVSRGHPLGATGLAQIHELVTQLRGEAGPRQVDGAKIAVQENGGGFIGFDEASCVVSILERPAEGRAA